MFVTGKSTVNNEEERKKSGEVDIFNQQDLRVLGNAKLVKGEISGVDTTVKCE